MKKIPSVHNYVPQRVRLRNINQGRRTDHDKRRIAIVATMFFVCELLSFAPFLLPAMAYSGSNVSIQSTVAAPTVASSGCTITSGGQEQKYMYTVAVDSSDHSKAYAITGAQITRNVVSGSNKVYLFIQIHPATTFALSSSGTISTCTQSYSVVTNNIYWYADQGINGRALGTVGGDAVVDSSTGLLLVNQYVDKNHYPGQIVSSKPASSTGPVSCFIDTLGQERNSIYMLFTDDSTGKSYVLSGASVVEKSVNGVLSSYLYVYISSQPMNINRSNLAKSCSATLSHATSEFEWAVRAPPPNNTIPGNYLIYGTLGGDVSVMSGTQAGTCDQFTDTNYQFP